MSFLALLVIAIGGFLGAIIRCEMALRFNDGLGFPLGTLFVNLAGAFLIGLVFGLEVPTILRYFLVSGLLGALTTFSTFLKESLLLWREKQYGKAFIYVGMTFVLGISFTLFGYLLGSYLS